MLPFVISLLPTHNSGRAGGAIPATAPDARRATGGSNPDKIRNNSGEYLPEHVKIMCSNFNLHVFQYFIYLSMTCIDWNTGTHGTHKNSTYTFLQLNQKPFFNKQSHKALLFIYKYISPRVYILVLEHLISCDISSSKTVSFR